MTSGTSRSTGRQCPEPPIPTGQIARQQPKTQALSLQLLEPAQEILVGLDGPPRGLTVPSGHDEGGLVQRTLMLDMWVMNPR
jgi:hypothetical protein